MAAPIRAKAARPRLRVGPLACGSTACRPVKVLLQALLSVWRVRTGLAQAQIPASDDEWLWDRATAEAAAWPWLYCL